MFYSPTAQKKTDYIIVPHYNDTAFYWNRYPERVLPTFVRDYKPFIDTLCSANLVISSSLHGIILAEAYGIPAVLLKKVNYPNTFIYFDYYESTGRYEFPVAETVEDALNISCSFPNKDRMKNMQQELIDVFPKDLWTQTE